MNDKQKQKEDLAKCIYGKRTNTLDNCKRIAEQLIEDEGYRKIDEGSVVISKEEYSGYDKLISQYRNLEINYNDMYENYRKYALENETLKQELAVLQTEYKQARKQAIKEFANDILNLVHNETFRKGYELEKVESRVKEIAKNKYGVKL